LTDLKTEWQAALESCFDIHQDRSQVMVKSEQRSAPRLSEAQFCDSCAQVCTAECRADA
jgi:hypothetical protein